MPTPLLSATLHVTPQVYRKMLVKKVLKLKPRRDEGDLAIQWMFVFLSNLTNLLFPWAPKLLTKTGGRTAFSKHTAQELQSHRFRCCLCPWTMLFGLAPAQRRLWLPALQTMPKRSRTSPAKWLRSPDEFGPLHSKAWEQRGGTDTMVPESLTQKKDEYPLSSQSSNSWRAI